MRQENAEPEVVTSAPPLESIPPHTDLEETFDGSGDETELDAARRRVAFFERRAEERQHLLEEARARVADLEARVESFRRVVRNGLDAIETADLLAAVERRGFQRPVPAASVLVRGDDGGDHAREDVAQ